MPDAELQTTRTVLNMHNTTYVMLMLLLSEVLPHSLETRRLGSVWTKLKLYACRSPTIVLIIAINSRCVTFVYIVHFEV